MLLEEIMSEHEINPKDSAAKNRVPLSLVPGTSLAQIATVMAWGDRKYSTANWRSKEISANVYLSAAERHIKKWRDGQDNDDETAISHLAHAAATLVIMLDAMACDTMIDDRPDPAPTDKVMKEMEKIIKSWNEKN